MTLNDTPVRYAFDVTGDICIIAPSTGVTTPTYTFCCVKDAMGNVVDMPITTINPSQKALQPFQKIQTGADLRTTPGRSGTTLYANNSAPPPDDHLDAAAKMFKDLSSAVTTLPGTPPAILSIGIKPLFDRGLPLMHIDTIS